MAPNLSNGEAPKRWDAQEAIGKFRDQQQALERGIQEYERALEAVHEQQSRLSEQLKKHQSEFRSLKKMMKDTGDRKHVEEVRQMESKINEWRQMLPSRGSLFLRLFVGELSVTLDHRGERIRFKTAYETFKAKMTPYWFIFNSLVLIWSYRVFDTVYHVFLTYYYVTLAIRENILRANGSNIKSWWIWHHYLSVVVCFLFIMWPDGPEYSEFRKQFFVFAFYIGAVQTLQTKYQMARLYTLRALGQANIMDVVNSDSTQIRWSPNMAVLVPFLLFGQAFQLYNGFCLAKIALKSEVWQVWPLAILFFCVGLGNILTTFVTIVQKRKADRNKSKHV